MFVQRGISNACIEYIHGVPDPTELKTAMRESGNMSRADTSQPHGIHGTPPIF